MLRTTPRICRRALTRSYTTANSPHALVFLEHRDGVIDSGSLSALTAAEKLGGQVSALVVGSPDHVPGVVDQAKQYVLYLSILNAMHGLNPAFIQTERRQLSSSFNIPAIQEHRF